MNKLLTISIASTIITIGMLPALAEVDPKIHKACIEARDYLGCVKAMNGADKKDAVKSGKAEARTKKILSSLNEFNKRQYISRNPNLAEWVHSNPIAANKEIEKNFLFYDDIDEVGSPKYSNRICKQRGKTVEPAIDWNVVCSHPKKESTEENNKSLYEAILQDLKREEDYANLEEECRIKSKSLKRINNEYICMTDYEYASYNQKELDRATKSYGGHQGSCPPGKRQYQKGYLFGLIKGKKLCLTDYEAEALRQGQRKIFSDSMNSLPRVVNCYSNTYGNYSSTSCY